MTEEIEIEGAKVLVDNRPPEPGEMYLAFGNDTKLLECKRVDCELGYVVSTCGAYPYDIKQCKTIIKILT